MSDAPKPKRKLLKLSCGVLALLLTGGGLFACFVLPGLVEADANRVLRPPPYQVSEAAQQLHQRLVIADLHADTLLWDRDLLARGERGQLDLPRLREGNVALQMFTCVTKTPADLNIERNDADTRDNITILAICQRWSPASWGSLLERALYQGRLLHDAAARSEGQLTLVRSQLELTHLLASRADTPGRVGGLLGIEGAHCLEGDLANVDTLYAMGFRMFGLVHFFDNEVGGSAHGVAKGGLTDFGKQVVERAESLGILIDLAHASPALIDDVLKIATRPVVVSHTGVKGVQDNRRNLSDDQLQRIAATRGVIGIGFWKTAIGGTDAAAIARSIRYTADLVGVDHVGLGSDFDGSVVAPFDVSGLALVTEALLAEGFAEDDIGKIMGGNLVRVLDQGLPKD